MKSRGPLAGVRVVEFAGLGPAPFCGMLLSDLGAEVVLIDRPGAPPRNAAAILYRGRTRVELDLKTQASIDHCLALLAHANVLVEGFRPGVMERLGLGPSQVLEINPQLVYGRMTGWGQTGPYARVAGHDINYIAIAGALHAIGPAVQPVPPLNLVGDFGGGALYLAFGIVSALLHARATGEGQVIDCAISDGTASLMAMIYGYHAERRWIDRRESNRLDGGAPFYATYECADGRWIALGSIEPQFYDELLTALGLEADLVPDRLDPIHWPELRRHIADRVATADQAEWCKRLEGTDVCFAPVLSLEEAPDHPHNVARRTFISIDGVSQPAPAPRFSRTPGEIQTGTDITGAVDNLIAQWADASGT